MAAPVNPARGMRDFLPTEKARREHALQTIRSVYAAHGFDEIETPVLEEFARLHSGLGGDNEKLSFSVLRRGLEPEDLRSAADAGSTESLTDLGLRFDLTVPLARFFASNRSALPGVFRSLQIAPVWRAERPQRGRFRQFVQADIDIIGESSILAELELITATAWALETLGVRGCTIRVNDRRLLGELLSWCGFAEAEHPRVLIEIDKQDKVGTDQVLEALRRLDPAATDRLAELLSTIDAARSVEELALTPSGLAAVLPEGVGQDARDSLAALGEALQQLPSGVLVTFDPTLVRGMGYYTGTIFEIAHPESQSSIGGGGRYDGMIGRFLGEQVPAVGFSIGFERIIDLIDIPHEAVARHIVLVFDPETPLERLTALKAELIEQGNRVRLERRAKKLTAQLDRAAQSGCTHFAVVSADAAHSSSLEIKPLRDE